MGGIVHTAYDTIEDLRRNLRDRYKDCYAVLKELLQNADDAGATELHISWVEGVSEAEHPLLCGPMLLIVNNGPFSYRDSFAIHLAGTGSKGHEEGKIGKFGLGLKSVFHLCEAFFYASDPAGDSEQADDTLRQFGRTGVLNPWYGARYASWDSFSAHDRTLLRRHARYLLSEQDSEWFGIFLPLRKQEHCKQRVDDDPGEWAIEPRYYGDASGSGGAMPPDELFSPRRIASIRQMLPLMSTLARVKFWRSATTIGHGPVLLADVAREATRHVDWRTMLAGRRDLAGTIEVTDNGENLCQVYAGVQELLSREDLRELTSREGWPRMDSQTESGRKRARAAVKQHAGVVIMERRGNGLLRIDRAVFLPLGDPPHPECQASGEHDFELMLHGYFFVDAGRLGVDVAPDNEEPTVRQEWNHTLYKEGTLPLVIPALAAYARMIEDSKDAGNRLWLLTRLLRHNDCRLWSEYRSCICRDLAWCFRLRSGGGAWCAVPNEFPVVLLPGDEKTDPGLPFVVFPILTQYADEMGLSLKGLPRLTASEESKWPDGLVEQMLESVPVGELVADEGKLGYLAAFCSHVQSEHDGDHAPAIIELVRRLLRVDQLSHLRRQQESAAALMELISPHKMLPIPFKTDLIRESERVFQALIELDTAILPIPDIFLRPREATENSITTPDARKMLQAISGLRPAGAQEEAFHSLVGQVVLVILSAWRGDSGQLLDEFGDLPLFYARDYSCDQRTSWSARQLRAFHEDGLVFAGNAGLCKKLQACLSEGKILFLSQHEIVRLLEEALGPIPVCDAVGAASLLVKRPALTADSAPRVDLLRSMLPALIGTEDQGLRGAVRYVLHGRQVETDADAALYVDSDGPWCALAKCTLSGLDQAWRMIPAPLTADISPSQAARLRLRKCDSDSVPPLFVGQDATTLDCSPVTERKQWQEQILRQWPDERKNVLKGIPIYTRSDGGTAVITGQTFIRGALPIPPKSVFPDLILIEDPTGVIEERDLAPTLSPADVIRAVLDLPDCHQHWQFILESMPADVPDDLRKALRDAPWLPTADEGCSPAEVIWRDGLAYYVHRIREAGHRLFHREDLLPALLDHARHDIADGLSPRGEDLYRRLGEALNNVPTFAVGMNVVGEDSLEAFIDMLGQDDSQKVMPAATLFRLLREGGSGGTQWIARHLLPAVKHTVEAGRAVEILKHLARRHATADQTGRRHLLGFYNSYLSEAVTQPSFRQHLPKLRFLNQENHWCKPAALAVSGNNIAASCLLHVSHADAMRQCLPTVPAGENGTAVQHDNAIAGDRVDSRALRKSASVLGKYLSTWRSDDIPDDALAAVVAMLGDNDSYPDLYDKLRDTRTLRAMRGVFSWQVAWTGWGLSQLMGKQHFCITPADAQTVTATNLLGERFGASVSEQISTLFDGFDGRTYFAMPNQERCHVIRLRQIDPEGLSSEEKLSVLGNTVRALRSLVHHQSDDDFQTAWSQITHVGQLDVSVAQDMILESSAMLLETQLSVRQDPKLRKLFTEWHQVRQRRMTATTDAERSEADADRHEVLESLRQLLRTDAETQRLLVSEIRKRLEAASYESASIPFELFQNGDDAVVELESLCGDSYALERVRLTELRCRFIASVVSIGGKTLLRFTHWGRGINQFRIGALDRRDRGFDRDMERMLVLQGSGKDDAGEGEPDKRTGKFGLGFKSVFFVCDSPCVLSGSRSRFRVLAGVYPEQLSDDEERQLEDVLSEEGDRSHKGTVVELSLRQSEDAEMALGRFRSLAGYLVVFARRIRQCSVGQAGRPGLDCQWHPTSILQGIEVGDVRVGPSCSQRALVFRVGADAYGAVLVPIVSGGVRPDALKGVPEVWVTTPTRHEGAGPLLVNGAYDLNPGRTLLRETDDNARLAETMGHELGGQLCALHRESRDNWVTLRERIGCHEASWGGFWSSMWDACVPYVTVDSQNRVMRSILFGSEHCGIHRLIREEDALPTNLPGEYECLTSLPKIRWRVRGILVEEDVWLSAAQSGWVRGNVRPGAIVARPVADTVSRFCNLDVRDLSLAVILDGATSEGRWISPEQAGELGRLIFPERMRTISSDRRWVQDDEELREILAALEFRNVAGNWCGAADLLVGCEPTGNQDELRRAAFAPEDHVLADDYRGDALKFFLACRKEMQASAEQMAKWICDAGDLPKRQAGLEYLERGELSFQVRLKLVGTPDLLDGSWLRDRAARNRAMAGMNADQRAALLGMLGMADEIAPPPPPPPSPPGRSPRAILEDIHSWWQQSHGDILAVHDGAIYPQGRMPNLNFAATADQLRSDAATRKEWLTLFMLGTMHRIGRVTHHQNRGFLDLCEERGWLDVLAGNSDNPSPWFEVMDTYLDGLQGDAAYFHWMNQFLAYYQLSRWLPSYARALEGFTRSRVNLPELLATRDWADLRTSHIFAGATGFDAPPCSRVLGLGSHFVLRETIRGRLAQSDGEYLVSPQLEQIAFVPSRAVRRLVAEILSGGDDADVAGSELLLSDETPREQAAKKICQVLRKHLKTHATFSGSFDIPLLVLTWGQYSAERAQFLGQDGYGVGESPLDFLSDSAESEDEQ